MDECNSNPCLNGATCIDKIASFTCSCPIGLTGKLCETNINDCEVSNYSISKCYTLNYSVKLIIQHEIILMLIISFVVFITIKLSVFNCLYISIFKWNICILNKIKNN